MLLPRSISRINDLSEHICSLYGDPSTVCPLHGEIKFFTALAVSFRLKFKPKRSSQPGPPLSGSSMVWISNRSVCARKWPILFRSISDSFRTIDCRKMPEILPASWWPPLTTEPELTAISGSLSLRDLITYFNCFRHINLVNLSI